eukprot:1999258-Rhodomonas_salina.1
MGATTKHGQNGRTCAQGSRKQKEGISRGTQVKEGIQRGFPNQCCLGQLLQNGCHKGREPGGGGRFRTHRRPVNNFRGHGQRGRMAEKTGVREGRWSWEDV